MLQARVVIQAPGVDAARLTELHARVSDLELRTKSVDLLEQALLKERDQAGREQRQAIDQRLSSTHNELLNLRANLEATRQQIRELEGERDGQRVGVTVQPQTADPFLGPKDILLVGSGAFLLMVPLVLALARRLWVRGVRRESVDLENSPRLQRIEQAIESIAVEVERIGEAQRFTTKLLAERQPGAVAAMAAPRREPGTITPH
jgi:hypothetical protein